MELGIHFIDFLPGDPARLAPTLAATAKAAEDAGATMFTMADHFFQMEAVGRAEDPFLEGYTSLGLLAGRTTSIALAMLVTGVTYRHPGLLAKTVATLDVLPQGRSMLGIGAAWYEREPYHGKHYQLAETLCVPQPIRRPPILIGGGGEKKTLRLVAQYADAWNSSDSESDVLKRKIEVLTRHCETTGRDVTQIRKTVGLFADPFADVAGYLKMLERYAEMGIEMVITGPVPGNPDPAGSVQRFGEELMPNVSEIC
ncbi:LLM class flavin-dependent oxidoreductase [Candidatus Mycobacterium methanotrophicum]|uniref:LLM class flavin-dependent oxidoreductase n=1 Tax=Candidatus Mycobacterium methanotrophicum TaxID=2943498 RepID=A0ABY4QPN2_9MYCO|nr:LLM class flavin-dependent oxidoreductase [Candidatus Mycobacterium methanotrophicum]UQX11926.1 LLM class flavin-dependent oxidoreductase [Candidatus Mycobacterium methanotrophicum]